MKEWRFIDSGTLSSSFNMALDEAIASFVRKGVSRTTLRFYEWEKPTVTLGYFQKSEEIDILYCRQKKIPLVRRLTGGRAVLHDNDLTYSFISPLDKHFFSHKIHENYANISKAFLLGFKKIGLDVSVKQKPSPKSVLKNPSCFSSVSFSEITIHAKKIIGSAQKKWHDGLLQQGSIVFDFDDRELCRIFRLQNCRDMGKICDYASSIDKRDLKKAFKEAFEETFEVKLISLYPESFEMKLAKELEREKYLSNSWNFRC